MSVRFGRYWSYANDVLDIFGEVGQICGSSAFFGSCRTNLVQVAPERIVQYIHGNLNMLHHNGAAEELAYVGVDVYGAFQLYFDGALTIEALEDAVEADDKLNLQLLIRDRLLSFEIQRRSPSPVIFYNDLGKSIIRL